MIKKVKTHELFCCDDALLKPLFEKHPFPWNILPCIGEYIHYIIGHPPEGYSLISKEIFAGKNVNIHPSATIEGPAIIGENTQIRPGAFIRGNTFIGPDCTIGNSTELKNCILISNVQVPHYNYVGDSVLGSGAHLGAGVICSNLKADGKPVVIHGDINYETGMRKVGAFLADGADIGCGCVLNPGTVIGKNTSVYPLSSLRGVFPENSIIKSNNDIVKRQ